MIRHQRCSVCGRMQRFEFSLNNEVWALADLDDAACIECFLERLDDGALTEERRIEIPPEAWLFLAVVGYRVGGLIRSDVGDLNERSAEETK